MINKRKLQSLIYQLFCMFVGLAVISPIIYCVLVSFMQPSEILTKRSASDTGLHLSGKLYKGCDSDGYFLCFMLNSFIVAFVSSVVRIITSSCAAYSFAFLSIREKVFILSHHRYYDHSHGCAAGTELFYRFRNEPDQYLYGNDGDFLCFRNEYFCDPPVFLSYSLSLKEAAHIDGCGNLQFFLQILLPTTTPALVTVFISSFVGTWNTYLWPLIVTNVNEMRTAQVAITMLNTEASSDFGVVMAAATIILIPPVLVLALFQRKIVGGMMGGAVKG